MLKNQQPIVLIQQHHQTVEVQHQVVRVMPQAAHPLTLTQVPKQTPMPMYHLKTKVINHCSVSDEQWFSYISVTSRMKKMSIFDKMTR